MSITTEELTEYCEEQNCNVKGYESLMDMVLRMYLGNNIEEAYDFFIIKKKEHYASKIIPYMPQSLIEGKVGEDLWNTALYFYFKNQDLFHEIGDISECL